MRGPMKKMYLRMEEIFTNPANYAEEVRKENQHWHQDERIAWEMLGTDERMAELGKLMEATNSAGGTDRQRQPYPVREGGLAIHGRGPAEVRGQTVAKAARAVIV